MGLLKLSFAWLELLLALYFSLVVVLTLSLMYLFALVAVDAIIA